MNTFGLDWCVCWGGDDALTQYRLCGAKCKFENVSVTESMKHAGMNYDL